MLGMPHYIHDYLIGLVHRPNGIFIATGPTDSGKMTTLYTCLRKVNTIDAKLLTAELSVASLLLPLQVQKYPIRAERASTNRRWSAN
jgi:hypothetical protein